LYDIFQSLVSGPMTETTQQHYQSPFVTYDQSSSVFTYIKILISSAKQSNLL